MIEARDFVEAALTHAEDLRRAVDFAHAQTPPGGVPGGSTTAESTRD